MNHESSIDDPYLQGMVPGLSRDVGPYGNRKGFRVPDVRTVIHRSCSARTVKPVVASEPLPERASVTAKYYPVILMAIIVPAEVFSVS